jgi:uncharacterized protein YcbK (DUF882 family)
MQDSSTSFVISAHRRRALRAIGLAALALPFSAPVRAAAPRSLSFYHTHTGERLSLVYFEHGKYLPDALASLNHLLRDFRSGAACEIDAALFDQLAALSLACGPGTFEVISAFRSPETNDMLRRRSDSVAKGSLHLQGRAIDVRLAGRDTSRLRDAAVAMKLGGVGYYARSDFVHLDTGRVRTW